MNTENAQQNVEITAVPTPNPNTVKFLINRIFLEKGSIDFSTIESAKGSLLAEKLFEIKGVSSVFIGSNFISISKNKDAGWEEVLDPATKYLKILLADHSLELIAPELIEKAQVQIHDDSDTVRKIKEILDQEIRPAIAMDGGDCQFHSFENGIVRLQLQGACSTCPSSVMTLKMGIENRLKEEIPEVEEVVQI